MADDPWKFTVLRAQGLHHLRNDTWRPIVSVEFDEHDHAHETVLGTDGQNTNQKLPFLLHSAHPTSRFELKVWHRSQTKKKTKKRTLLAASSSQSLGDLWKKQQEQSDQKSVEIRLHCQNKNKSCTSVTPKGRLRSGPAVHLRLQPPSSFLQPPKITIDTDDELSDTLTASPLSSSEDESLPDPIDQLGVRHEEMHFSKKTIRRRKGYKVFSDEDSAYEEVEIDEEAEDEEILRRLEMSTTSVKIVDLEEVQEQEQSAVFGWIAASILPSHLSHAKPDRRDTADMGHIERAVDHCTVYRRLRYCETDSDFEKTHFILVQEWKYCAGLLIGLAAVDVTVFAITPDAILPVDGNMRKILALSSVFSAAGFFSSCNLLFWYGYVGSVHSFKKDVLDQYGSYFFFSISSRVPALCMLGASTSLFILFIMVVAQAWVIVILAAGAFVGVLSSLHFWHRSVWAVAIRIRSLFTWAKEKWRGPPAEAVAAAVTPAEVMKSEEKCWDPDADTLHEA